MMNRALLSAHEGPATLAFATALIEKGWAVIATSNLVDLLRREGIEVQDVAEFVCATDQFSFPPTLHPLMEQALTTNCAERIDLIYDLPYPLTQGNDVGGHTLLALGVKGERIVICDEADLERVASFVPRRSEPAGFPITLKKELENKAMRQIIGHYLGVADMTDDPVVSGLVGTRAWRLANGENPYQQPADLLSCDTDDPLALHRFERIGESDPCYTNLADVDAILHTLCLAQEAFLRSFGKVPLIAIGAKHGNPCGMAFNWESTQICLEDTLFGNPLAIWGGECITNFPVTASDAKTLYRSERRKTDLGNAYWMLDVICAPDFEKSSLGILGKRKSRHLLKNPALISPMLSSERSRYRQVRGGLLREPPPDFVLDISMLNRNDAFTVNDDIAGQLIIAWSVAFSSFHGGNEVALVKGNRLIGVGGGPSTVEAASIAVQRANDNNHDQEEAVFAADAFFPFTDAPRHLARAGCVAGVVPSGGKRETEVKEFFEGQKMRVLFLPPDIRGFCRH
ncbi:MAG: hypothetical protein GY847_19175 [Proteobacteria bacterium]|nr:hypothetical protein [Pseudomonadota bacterium]